MVFERLRFVLLDEDRSTEFAVHTDGIQVEACEAGHMVDIADRDSELSAACHN